MTSEVMLGHDIGCCGLLLVALEHGDQAKECKDGAIDETNIGGGDGALCFECLDGRVIPSKIMVGPGTSCCGLLPEVMAHGPCLGTLSIRIKANPEEVGRVILEGMGGPT